MTSETQTSTGCFKTDNASKYLQQLCKHFGHKVGSQFDTTTGRVDFPFGPATMAASDTALEVTVEAPDSDGLARARGVIDSHLARFAFREEFEAMEWV